MVAALDDARHIDVGALDYDFAPPDNQVGFFRGDELVERLGYYENVSAWGEHEVNGRRVTHEWGLLAVTDDLPALNGAAGARRHRARTGTTATAAAPSLLAGCTLGMQPEAGSEQVTEGRAGSPSGVVR